jgi:hypothetical protein
VRGKTRFFGQIREPTRDHNQPKRQQVRPTSQTRHASDVSLRVVTGVRFVKRNRIVHLQVQEGRLLPEGQIDVTTIRWLPVHDSGPDASSGIDYHALTWEKRSVDLDPVRTNKGTVVTGKTTNQNRQTNDYPTGVRFRYSSSLNLEILVTPFNFTTGELLNPRALRVFKESQNAALRNR